MSPRKQAMALAFGAALRESRMEVGFSQEQLALTAGIDRTYASLLERGLRTPTLTVLLLLADTLGVSAALLVQRTLSYVEQSRAASEVGRPRMAVARDDAAVRSLERKAR
ncbi:MAG TPA: helix-turn-helix domain-containing protein [Steroidobacteraceae bacterium]|jgi:transcriptional regulator with XRE-family HTH domain